MRVIGLEMTAERGRDGIVDTAGQPRPNASDHPEAPAPVPAPVPSGRWVGLAGYGVGDFGLNIYWHSLSLILVFWYTTVVGLDPKTAGWIYAAGLLWDAISDPLVAAIAAGNRSRWGSYRPFLLFGSFGLAASFCLLFWRPPLEGWALIAALLAAGVLFRTCYTIVAVPYAALSSRLTFDSDERAELSGVRMFFAFCGMLCISSLFFPLSRFLGSHQPGDWQGYFYTAALGGVVATLALVICFLKTSERPPIGGDIPQGGLSMRRFAHAFMHNDALRLLLVVLFCNSAAGASFLIPLAFYLQANADIFANKEVVFTAFTLATLAAIPIWTLITRQFGKKYCWYLATAWCAFTGLFLFATGPIVMFGIPLQIAMFGIGHAAFAVIIWALIPDAVEYGQYAYGRRDEGPVFGASLLVQKASGAFAGLLVGYVLSGIGYNNDSAVQDSGTIAGLEAFLALVPPAFLIAAAIVLWLMPLSRDLHARIVDELSR